jgi:DNA-binding NtrC family response regulator
VSDHLAFDRPISAAGDDDNLVDGHPGAGGRVLVVDDDATVRRGLCRALRADGHTVSEARSAEDAWEILNRVHARPEVMVLDLMLPDESGLSFLARLPQPLAVGVVLVSGQGRIPHAVEALRLGAIDFLEKPLGVDRLRPAVMRALATHRDRLDSAFSDSLAFAAAQEPPLAGPKLKKSVAPKFEPAKVGTPTTPVPPRGPLQSILDESERRLLRSTLELCEGNVAAAARVLQLDRGNLFRRLKRLGMR